MTIELPPAVSVEPLRRADHGDVLEDVLQRRHDSTEEPQRRLVDHVLGENASVAQHLRDLSDELPRRQVPGDRPAAEGVADDGSADSAGSVETWRLASPMRTRSRGPSSRPSSSSASSTTPGSSSNTTLSEPGRVAST